MVYEEINYQKIDSTIRFAIEGRERISNFSESKFKLKVQDGKKGNYVARVLLAGGIGFASGNIKMQKKDFAFSDSELEFSVTAYRNGFAEMFVYLFDMYNSDNHGISNVWEILVV